MHVLLQIFGVMFLLLILLIVVVFLVIRAKIRSFVKKLEGMANLLGTGAPPHIHLTPLVEAHWNDPSGMSALTHGIEELGFEKAGDFEVEEVEGMSLEAWVDPARSTTCVFCEHPKAGLWFDVYTHFEDGTRITYTNNATGAGVDHAPGHTVVREPALSLRELHQRFLAERPDKPAKPVSAATFAETYEQVYAEEMEWRNSRGGPTEEEIRNVLSLTGKSFDEAAVTATRALMERQALENLTESLREHFLTESSISAVEWERVRDQVVFVHDKMTQELFEETVGPWLEEDDLPEVGDEPGSRPREVFRRLNEQLAPDEQFRRLGTVSAPIEADVYTAPED